MKYFDFLSISTGTYIIKEREEIIATINTTANRYSNKTTTIWLNDFHDLLKAIGFNNPMLISSYCDRLKIPKEIWPICCKMIHFILSNGYITICNESESKKMKDSHIKYNYEIPLLFMPILMSFIETIRAKRTEKTPISSFFKQMDTLLKKYPYEDISKKYSCIHKEILTEVYNEWMLTYLGQNFFIHFEELLIECAKSERQKSILQDALGGLIAEAAPPIMYNIPSETDMIRLDYLLIKYKDDLKKEINKKLEKKQNIDSLYEYCQPYKLSGEESYLSEICNQFSNNVNTLSSKIKKFISQEHKPGSLYIIAIDDLKKLDIFEEKVKRFLNNTQTKIAENIQNYYYRLEQPKTEEDEFLQKLYKSNILFFNKENNNCKIEKLSIIFNHAMEEISNITEKFFKNVRRASDGKAPDFTASTTENRFKTLNVTVKIDEVEKHTIRKIMNENFPETLPSVFQHMPYVYQIGYPYFSQHTASNDSMYFTNNTSAGSR